MLPKARKIIAAEISGMEGIMTVKKFLNTYIKKYFGSFLSILICVLFIGFIRQIFPKLFGLMIDEVFIANNDLWILLVEILSYGILFICLKYCISLTIPHFLI